MPMDKHIYSLLSERSVHVNPHTTPQGHNALGLPTLGSYFQEAGALLVLNHLAGMVGDPASMFREDVGQNLYRELG